jgi:signal peptidase I
MRAHSRQHSEGIFSQIGYVPLENIVGHAGMIYFSVGGDAAGNGSRFRTERLGLIVR